jgi:hypothetical protein
LVDGDEDPKLTDSWEKLSRFVLSRSELADGYSSVLDDIQHSSEPTYDTITPMLLLHPESPEWIGRARKLARFMENLWTGVNQRGFRCADLPARTDNRRPHGHGRRQTSCGCGISLLERGWVSACNHLSAHNHVRKTHTGSTTRLYGGAVVRPRYMETLWL